MIRVALFLFLISSTTLYAQKINVSLTEYSLRLPSAFVNTEGVIVSDGNTTLVSGKYEILDQPDPSLKVFALQNGGVILRENIANFLFYDSYGRVSKSVSNSTQSKEGEAISELAYDPKGKTIVLYNPKVVIDGNTGSRAKLVAKNSSPIDIFYSSNRALRTVKIASNGELIALASMSEGAGDELTILDRFGNNLGVFPFNQKVKGVSFSENGLYVTVYSSGRIAVYNIINKKRIGSTSIRKNSILYANFSPEDNAIIAITGAGVKTFKNLEAHIIQIDARKINKVTIKADISEIHKARFERIKRGNYTIEGFNKIISLKISL